VPFAVDTADGTFYLLEVMGELYCSRFYVLSLFCCSLISCGGGQKEKVQDGATTVVVDNRKNSLEMDYPEEYPLSGDGHNLVDEIAEWFSDNAAKRVADRFTEKLSQKGKIGREIAGVRSRSHGNAARDLENRKRSALKKGRRVEKECLCLDKKEISCWSADEAAWHMADSLSSVASYNTYCKMYPSGKYLYLAERKCVDKQVADLFLKDVSGDDSVSCGTSVGSANTQFSISNNSIYTMRIYVSGEQSFCFDVKSGFKRMFTFRNGIYKIASRPLENADIAPNLFSVKFNGDGFVLCFSPLKDVSKFYAEGFFESQYNDLITGAN